MNNNKSFGIATRPKLPESTYTYAIATIISSTNGVDLSLKIGGLEPKVFDTFTDAVIWCRDKNREQSLTKTAIQFVAVKAEVTTEGTLFAFNLDGQAFTLKKK